MLHVVSAPEETSPDKNIVDRRARLGRLDYLVVSIITVAGALLRFVSLGRPGSLVFDEVYYAKDACFYARGAAEVCPLDYEQTLVHPPLGKWLLSIGVKLFGYDSFGWRVAAAAAGTITIVLLYLLAKRLLRSTLGAALASGLLAIDLLHLVQSRISMLDIFVPMFALAALLFLVVERDHRNAGADGTTILRLGAGLMLGGALASKWSGGFFLPLAMALVVAWEIGRRRRSNLDRPVVSGLMSELASCAVFFVLVPLALYVVTYLGRVEGTFLALPWSDGSFFRAVWEQQFSMLDYHAHLTQLHSYQSPPWTWPLVKRPVSYFFDSSGGTYREVMAFGSPFVWWSSLLALAFTGYRWVRTRSVGSPEGVILAGFLFAYLPWLVQSTGRDAIFLFYLLPAVPFMCLALAYVAVRIGDGIEARITITVFVAAAIGFFIYFMPLALDRPISEDAWRARIWFESCTKPEGYEGSPDGWCWI